MADTDAQVVLEYVALKARVEQMLKEFKETAEQLQVATVRVQKLMRAKQVRSYHIPAPYNCTVDFRTLKKAKALKRKEKEALMKDLVQNQERARRIWEIVDMKKEEYVDEVALLPAQTFTQMIPINIK